MFTHVNLSRNTAEQQQRRWRGVGTRGNENPLHNGVMRVLEARMGAASYEIARRVRSCADPPRDT